MLEQIFNQLQTLVKQNDKFKNAYYWSPPSVASSRRGYEAKNSIKKFDFCFQDNKYSFELEISCSAKNIYVYRNYFKNGVKTTITTAKNLLKKIAFQELQANNISEKYLLECFNMSKRQLKLLKPVLLACVLSNTYPALTKELLKNVE